MKRAQFAIAVRADEKWVENAARLLNRRFRYTRESAVWLGLVRVLHQEVGLTLSQSANLASEALGNEMPRGTVTVGQGDAGVAGVSIDMDRYLSAAAAAFSSALVHGGERRRGRPRAAARGKTAALRHAADYGVDLDLLRAGLRLTPAERLEQLDENAQFISALEPVANRR